MFRAAGKFNQLNGGAATTGTAESPMPPLPSCPRALAPQHHTAVKRANRGLPDGETPTFLVKGLRPCSVARAGDQGPGQKATIDTQDARCITVAASNPHA